jgi:hypothetical protein
MATPIPTTARTSEPSPAAAVAKSSDGTTQPAPSPRAANPRTSEQQVEQVRGELEQALASQDLPGIERLLLEKVLMSSAEGGEVLDRNAAAQWLRERAGPGMRVTRVEPSALAVVLQVVSEGWPIQPPIGSGRVTFNLHRYDASGRQDDENGEWKIDVVTAE